MIIVQEWKSVDDFDPENEHVQIHLQNNYNWIHRAGHQ